MDVLPSRGRQEKPFRGQRSFRSLFTCVIWGWKSTGCSARTALLALAEFFSGYGNSRLHAGPTPANGCLPVWACSSVVEHCVDIAGVASSILATPTTGISILA